MDIGRRTPFVSWPGSGGPPASWGNIVPPAITGTVLPGYTLTVSDGTWTTLPTGFQYQWRRVGVDIPGATGNTYVLNGSDVNLDIDCQVRATDGALYVGSALSNVVNTGPYSGFPYCPPDQPAAYWNVIAGTNWGASSITRTDRTALQNSGSPRVMQDGRIFLPGTASAQIYDPVADTFSLTAAVLPAGTSVSYKGTVLCDGRIFCMMESAAVGAVCKGVIYDPATDTAVDAAAGSPVWPTATYTSPTFWGSLVMSDGRVFISPCGRSSNNRALIYDPATDTVTAITATLPTGEHQFYGCCLLRDGRVFLVPANSSTGRVYDPVAGTYATTPSFIQESTSVTRRYQGAVQLVDGRVVLFPGWNRTIAYWNPATNVVSYGVSCWSDSFRPGGSGCLLPDGKLFINQYQSVGSRPYFIYDPATDTFISTANTQAEDNPYAVPAPCMMPDGRVFIYRSRLGPGNVVRIFGTSIAGIPPVRYLGPPVITNA